MKRRSSRSIGGFTLVELLVVIGIIALLISLLLPVLGSARKAAQGVACLSNLKQVAIASQFYEQDHKKVRIFGSEQYFQWTTGYGFAYWYKLGGYLEAAQELTFGAAAQGTAEAEWYMCPNAELPANTTPGNALRFHPYGSNFRFLVRNQLESPGWERQLMNDERRWAIYIKFGSVKDASNAILFADTVMDTVGPYHERAIKPNGSNFWGVHRDDHANVLMADLHAEGMGVGKLRDLYVPTAQVINIR